MPSTVGVSRDRRYQKPKHNGDSQGRRKGSHTYVCTPPPLLPTTLLLLLFSLREAPSHRHGQHREVAPSSIETGRVRTARLHAEYQPLSCFPSPYIAVSKQHGRSNSSRDACCCKNMFDRFSGERERVLCQQKQVLTLTRYRTHVYHCRFTRQGTSRGLGRWGVRGWSTRFVLLPSLRRIGGASPLPSLAQGFDTNAFPTTLVLSVPCT